MWPRCSRSVNGRSSAWLVLYCRFAVVQTKLGALKALPCWCAATDVAVDKVVAQVSNPMPLTFWKSRFECEASLSARRFDCREDLRLVILGSGLIWPRFAAVRQFRGGRFFQQPEQALPAQGARHPVQEQF